MTEAEPAPRQTRNTTRTRRAILDAATRLMGEQGTAVSLADVAAEAGVSKSGLLHHFPTRERLVLDVVLDANARFRAFVLEHVDPTENLPGTMVRAYVRALCTTETEFAMYFGSSPLWNGLQSFPGIQETLSLDMQWWEAQLLGDGLDADLVHVVRRAAEGVAAAASYSDESAERLARMRRALIEMTKGVLPAISA